MRRSRALAVLSLALASCAGPRPSTPQSAAVVPPPGWRDGQVGRDEVHSDWWIAFGDQALTRVVEVALERNLDLAIAVSRIEEARAQSRLARSYLLPTLDVGAAGLRERTVGPFGTAEVQTAGEPQITASYDIDLFGRLAASSAAARANLLATRYARDTLRLAIASTAANAYITLRALDARLEVARATLTDREFAVRLARRRSDTGYSSLLETRQAEAEYSATQALVPQAQLAVARQENALRLLMGDVPGNISRGAGIAALVVPPVPAGLPSEVLRRRPDIAEGEQLIVAADRTLDSARAAFLPSIRLTGSSGAVLSTLLPNPITIWSLGGSVLAPLFEGGRLRAQADAAASRRDQAAFAYRRTALQAFREVEDGLAASSKTSQQLVALRGQRDALAAALRLATNRYEAGYAPYIDQLDAQRGLLSSELGVIQAEADRLTAAVALFEAMGGGWNPAAAAAR